MLMLRRGAGASKGRTSWSAKPERLDYVSFVGLFTYYLNDLEPPLSTTAPIPTSPTSHKLTTIKSSIQSSGGPQRLTLVLGGYSYGSLIVTLLPPVEEIIKHFNNVTRGTAEAEIRLRATHLAKEWNAQAQAVRKRGRTLQVDDALKSPRSATFGGEESDPGTRRASRDSRRSIDGIRRSIDRSKSRLSIGRKSSRDEVLQSLQSSHPEELLDHVQMPPINPRYLLVSPLCGPVSSFLTMFSKQWPFRKAPVVSPTPKDRLSLLPTEEQFWHYPTFAIYGDSDGFTSKQRIRKWTDELKAKPDSFVVTSEVSGAGHFWIENEEEKIMKIRVREWVLS